MNNIFKIPAFQRRKAIPKQLKDLELLPLNEQFSKLTMSIVGDDDMRPVMTGNFFDMESKKIVSTDAYKLTAINMPNRTFDFIKQTYNKELDKEPRGLIFHTLKQLQKDYNDLAKLISEKKGDILTFDEFVKDRAIEDGRYPNYEAVIPKEFTNVINVDYQKLYWYTKVLLDAKVIDDVTKINTSNANEYQNKKIEYLKDSYISFLNPVTKQIILTYLSDDGTIQYMGFNARLLCDLLKFAMEFNGKTFGKVGLSGNSRAMVIELENGLNVINDSIGIVMPIMLVSGEFDNTIGDIDFDLSVAMYYDLDTNSIISDKENYPINESIGFMPNKAGLSTPNIRVKEEVSKVENNSEDLIDKKIRGLKIALKVAIKGEEKLIEKRILALEIAKKMSNPKVSVSEKMSKLDNNKIKDWYIKNYPADDLKNKLDDKNTFEDLWNGLGKNKDIYEVIGIGDSLIRERLFGHLAKLKGVDYDVVYNKWLDDRETGDNVDKRNKEGMIYALQEFISAGTIANKTDYSNYDKIAEIRSKAIQYYEKNGDKQYSLGELDKVLSIVSNSISDKFAKGGSIGFKGLSNKVASRYEGKKVPQRFQSIYGKTYSQSEAKEVGNKVAGKVYREQQANKMAKGGMVEFYDYKGVEIMYEPTYEEYFVNDMVFNTLEKAHKYIDSGEANKPPTYIENLYRRGMMAKGGKVEVTIGSYTDFKNKVVITANKRKNDNSYEVIVKRYPSAENIVEYPRTMNRVVFAKNYINAIGKYTDGEIGIGTFTEWIKANSLDYNNLFDYAEKNNVIMPKYYAKGGKVERVSINVLNELYNLRDEGVTQVQLNGFSESIGYVIGLRLDDTEIKKVGNNAYITLYENGGSVEIERISMSRLLSEFKNEKEIFDGQIVNRGVNQFKIENDIFYIKRPNENWEVFRKIKYENGGSVDEQTYIDLFEDYENIPAEVQMILDEYSESFEDGDYIGMSKAQNELEQIGYTFDFYVDGDAYGLRPMNVKLSQIQGYEDEDEE